MRRIPAVLIIVLLLLTLTACSGNNDRKSPKGGGGAGDIYELVMEFPTLGSTPADLQMVEDAINKKTEDAIGVRVKFYPVNADELNSTTNLMVYSGEKLDLVMSMFEGGIGSYVNKGILMELDDLVEKYGADIVAAEGKAMSGGYFGGKLYAVPTEEKMGRVKGFVARKDLLDKYGIDYDPDHIYTEKELTEIFSIVKAGEGDQFYCIATNAGEDPMYSYAGPVDFLGSSLASGCLLNYGVDTEKIVNYFETPQYAEACAYARDWYEKGYFSPDCNTITDTMLTQMQSGGYLGCFENSEPDIIAKQSALTQASLGTDLVPLYTAAPAAMTQYYQLTLWAIPITCENPEKTMKWLNMMYADSEIINLLAWGIEGVHYRFAKDSNLVIEYPDGDRANDLPYHPVLNVWGDKSREYIMEPLDETYYQTLKKFNDSIDAAHTSAALGYCFNSNPVKVEFAAVTDIMSKYQMSLSMGVVAPDKVLPTFRAALKEAGIDRVIAENQRQFDAWLLAQGR